MKQPVLLTRGGAWNRLSLNFTTGTSLRPNGLGSKPGLYITCQSLKIYRMIKKIFRPIGLWLTFLLVLGLVTAVSAAQEVQTGVDGSSTPVPEQISSAPEADQPAQFSFEEVISQARLAAAKPFKAVEPRLVEYLRSISEAQWQALSFKEENRFWAEGGGPFEVGFFHPGFIYDQPVVINVVEEGASQPLPFRPDWFQSAADLNGGSKVPLNYAGFRLLFPLNSSEETDELLSFLGATHFRALARQTGYGLTARGLIINPAQPDGEEFPYFRQFWLVKPEPGATSLTVYALMESPSLTGAYSFSIRPGTSTVMEVEVRLFPRSGAARPKKVGLAPLGSMYLFSEKENGSAGDYRPEVHNSDTLLFSGGRNAWFNRPLNNPERLEIKSYPLNNPQGFGLMQNDSIFDHYQDLPARFDRRPSLWVEPVGDWGAGHLELIEIPSSQEIHDNILAFWVADEPKNINGADPDRRFAYRLYWMAPGVIPHQLGRVVATRQVPSPKRDYFTFLLDFESEELNSISAETGLASVVDAGPEATVGRKALIKNPVTGGWRLQFDVSPTQENGVMQSLMSARGDRRCLPLRAFLKKGENLSEPLTETWLYDLCY